MRFADKTRSGERYRNSDLEPRIVSLYGDSGSFDYSPYEGKMDLVFIDASHTFEYVVNDSLQALRLLRERGGAILWHDYGRWDGVTSALHELKRRRSEFVNLVQVGATTLAVARITR
jgi:hypothetical protein